MRVVGGSQGTTPRWSACVFDFDGVIIDSEPLHAEAKRITLSHFLIPHPDELFANFKGRPDSAFFQYVSAELANGRATAQELEAYKVATYLDLFDDVPLVPGAVDFLAAARRAFPKLGLATSATRHDFELGARKYQLTKWFDAIVTGDDTARHKPDPEPYTKVLAALGVINSAALVIEDSPNGIRAAKAAQCDVVGLMTNFQAKELRDAGADGVVASYTELVEALGLAIASARSLEAILQSTADVLFPDILEGAKVDLTSRSDDGDTALHVMVWRDDAEGVRLILDAGADPNVTGDMTETPLHVAWRRGNHEIMDLLLRAGARTDIRSEFGETVAELRAKADHLKHWKRFPH